MIAGPNWLVYVAGTKGKRDETKIRPFASALGVAPYDAKIMLGAPGPRRVAAFAKEEEAQEKALSLRQIGIIAFVIDKERFSRLPKVFKALKAVEQPELLMFTIETPPAPGEIQAQISELPQPKGFVRAVIAGVTRQTSVHSEHAKRSTTMSSLNEIREPFLHLYSEDPHTILEIKGPRFECAWLKELSGVFGDQRWLKLAERFATYYGAKLDTTLMGPPEEAAAITAMLNVDALKGSGGMGSATSSSSVDDTPIVMAASRIVVYSIVFGV